jgi:hypothetical protein
MNAYLAPLIALVLGVGVPVAGMRLLAPSLAEGRAVENYRGRRVFLGLGIAWLLWSGAAIVGGVAGPALAGEGSVLAILTLAGPLALVAFALGIVDDEYGTSADRGFRGHVRALARGRLTTGGMKLLGLSLACYVVALFVSGARGSDIDSALLWILALPAGAAMALTANLVNLTDLRPGRALKVYATLGALGVASVVLGLAPLVSATPQVRGTDALALALFVAGPLLATWRYDLGEQGMMGDAGANAAGAVAGLLIVAGLPFWAMLAYLVFVFALNLASERVSFSAVIERSTLLRRLDAIGRVPDEPLTNQTLESDPHDDAPK